MDIERLKAFCLVAEFGGLSKTAENLGLTVSWISKQITSLEKEIGYALFFHSGKKFVLTEEGKIFLGSAHNILKELKRAQNLLESNKDTLSGDIVISTSNAMASLFMIDAIADFLKRYKDIHLIIVGSDDLSHFVFGKIDVAVRPFTENHEDFEKKELVEYEMHLYASADYIKSYGEVKTKEDIQKHRIISYGEYAVLPYKEVNWHLELLPTGFQPCLSINSGAAMLRAVESGLGVAPLSQIGARQSKVPLIKILPQYPGPVVKIYFYYPESMKQVEKIKILYTHLRAFFSDQK